MNNIKFLGILLAFFLLSRAGFAQQDQFIVRLGEVRVQLEILADSLVLGLNETANFSVSNTPIQTFLRTVAESHRLNIQIDPALNFVLTNNFTNVPVKDLLYFICQEYQLDIRFTSTIMSFYKYQFPPVVQKAIPKKIVNISFNPSQNLVTFDLSNDSLINVVREITRLTNRNVVASGGSIVEDKLLKGYIKDMPLENALDKLAYINGLHLVKTRDGVLIFELPDVQPGSQQHFTNGNVTQRVSRLQSQSDVQVKDSLVSIDVVDTQILEIINQASSQLGVSYILFSEITGNTTARVKDVTYDQLLSFLFQSTGFTYKRKGGVYLIGQRNQEGFRGTELIKLNYRTIDGVEREIPTDLLKEIELKPLKELNSFIITGNKHRIDEVMAFLKMVDKPVPNILIEVIVADTRKGFSIETGLKAALSDSIPTTQGALFPGVDMTVSSSGVNSFLDKLDSKGIVNLGRVTPKFYATLKLLEQNNNIQVRSTPKLSTMNGSKANLTIGESVYYLEQTQNITGGVNPITTIVPRYNKVEANLAITISPVVSGNEHITLDIVAEFSDFIKPTIPNAPPGNATRKFESKIRIKNEEMIILGGLEELSKTETGSGVPFLARVPVIKWFFSSRSKQTSNNRLIVFIKPTLVY